MPTLIDTAKRPETAILVSVIDKGGSLEQAAEHLDELEFLATTAGIHTKTRFVQRLDHPDKATFVGSGKLEEIQAYLKAEPSELVIFDDDLSPSQVRNLEQELKCTIYDRSLLILDIFLLRAKTAQARTQVELARYQYLLPRLRGMWTHLERQRGGTGTRGGAGEKEIETDRRIVKQQISLLKTKLEKLDKQSITQRKNRDKVVRVALVGYTNVGKSTLMNLVAKSDVFAENKLFATVDSTVRKVVLDGLPFLLTDTVGFIRKLPHNLIESFKSTLDEVREADMLVHVADISHAACEEHIEVVRQTLAELKAAEKPVLLVLNKVDALDRQGEALEPFIEQLQRSYHNHPASKTVFISATKGIGLETFRKTLTEMIYPLHMRIYPNYVLPPGFAPIGQMH
jgi:GTP-binding protein HflX